MSRSASASERRHGAQPGGSLGRAGSGPVARLGALAYRRRRWVVAMWPLLLVALLGAAAGAGGEFRQSFALPGSETEAAMERLAAAGFEGRGGQEGTVVVRAPDGVSDPAVRAPVEAYLEAIPREVEGVLVRGPYDPPAGAQISGDGQVAFAALDFGDVGFTTATERAAAVAALGADLDLPAGVDVEFGGDAFAAEPEFSSEGVGLLAAAVILLLAFGSVLAMGLPIVTALLGIGCGVAVVQFATLWIEIPPFAPAAVAMLGIGVGIDYALFIVTRFREELAAGYEPEAAVTRAMGTAGRSTVFAGATVVTSLLGLLVIGLDDVRSLALAAAAGVGFVMLSSVTLLPALLGFAGRNIDRLGLPHRRRPGTGGTERSLWYRWSRLVQRRPLPVALAALAVLLLLAAPVTSLRLGLTDASTRPATDTTRRAHDLLAGAFGPGASTPLVVAVSLPGEGAAAERALVTLDAAIAADGGVAATAPPLLDAAGTTALVLVTPATGLQAEATYDLVLRLREATLPAALDGTGADALVGGVGAAAVDFAAHNARTLPWFVAVVLLLSFVLLLMLFRSVVVPLTAMAVNLLSVGAAYGVVVAVFQWGWLGGLFGLGEPGPVEAWVPMMLFAIVFGLSIDYEVFLLSRIRERYEATGDNARAVADGIARTARVIAAAAAIMVCVFGAFALSADRALQMLGLGLAAAIAVDATLVRLVLVPATMGLLGDRNWWWPRWLEGVLPGSRAHEPSREVSGV